MRQSFCRLDVQFPGSGWRRGGADDVQIGNKYKNTFKVKETKRVEGGIPGGPHNDVRHFGGVRRDKKPEFPSQVFSKTVTPVPTMKPGGQLFGLLKGLNRGDLGRGDP